MSDGVIYGVQIDRPEADGPMRAGPVVTVCIRLPEWVILDSRTEYNFRRALAAAVAVVTGSEQSKASRALQNKGGLDNAHG